MKVQQFIQWAESAYGKYFPMMKIEVEKWLSEWDEDRIDVLRHVVLIDYQDFGRPPNFNAIARLQDAVEAMIEAAAPKQIESVRPDVQFQGEHVPLDFEAAWRKIVSSKTVTPGKKKDI